MFDRSTIDPAIDTLVQHKKEWLVVTLPQRVLYLQKCMASVQRASSSWVAAAVRAKGQEPVDLLSSEEWVAGPMATLLYLRTMLRTLQAPGQPVATRTVNEQLVATVFPDQFMDRLLWPGYRGEVWIAPGEPASQRKCYQLRPCKHIKQIRTI